MARTIEVRHEGGLVYLDGYGMTNEEADALARRLATAADAAWSWRRKAEYDRERERRLASMAAGGLTDITLASVYGPGGRARYLARRDGLPVVVDGGSERPALYPTEVGPGPALEARVYGGRKWWAHESLTAGQRVSAWRVVAP